MSRRHGLSRVEVLLGIGIFVLLLGLLIPVVGHVRESAMRTTNTNNLKQIALACHSYAGAKQDRLPPLTDVGANAPTGAGLQSLFFSLLPYIQQENVYRRFDRSAPESYYSPDTGAAQMYVKTYINPADYTAPYGA